ncbi:MAG: DUF2520 domain-containing protein [Bdellovibrionales bacterium]
MKEEKAKSNTQANAFTSFALVGSGRLARHLLFYLHCLNLPVHAWSRDGNPCFNSSADLDADARLQKVLGQSSHVLLAVKDSAIAELSRQCRPDQTVVHFSGALNIPTAIAAHPLMTFGTELEDVEWYRKIPFVIDEGHEFRDLLPGLPNPSYVLSPEQRPFYHALCSLAGNSTFLLWKQIGEEFESILHLPRSLLSPFLHQVVSNSSRFSMADFTGPVARGDWEVVKAHLQSLSQRPDLLEAYRTYLRLVESTGTRIPEPEVWTGVPK